MCTLVESAKKVVFALAIVFVAVDLTGCYSIDETPEEPKGSPGEPVPGMPPPSNQGPRQPRYAPTGFGGPPVARKGAPRRQERSMGFRAQTGSNGDANGYVEKIMRETGGPGTQCGMGSGVQCGRDSPGVTCDTNRGICVAQHTSLNFVWHCMDEKRIKGLLDKSIPSPCLSGGMPELVDNKKGYCVYKCPRGALLERCLVDSDCADIVSSDSVGANGIVTKQKCTEGWCMPTDDDPEIAAKLRKRRNAWKDGDPPCYVRLYGRSISRRYDLPLKLQDIIQVFGFEQTCLHNYTCAIKHADYVDANTHSASFSTLWDSRGPFDQITLRGKCLRKPNAMVAEDMSECLSRNTMTDMKGNEICAPSLENDPCLSDSDCKQGLVCSTTVGRGSIVDGMVCRRP